MPVYKTLGSNYFLHVSPPRMGRVYFTVLQGTGKRHWLTKNPLYRVVHTGKAWDKTFAERKAKKWLRSEGLL